MKYLLLLIVILGTFSLKADTLKVGYNISPPFVMEENGELYGTSVWLWNEVSKNKTDHIELVQYPLDSMLSALESGQIDLSLNPITINSERIGAMDFTVPFYLAYSGVLTRDESSFSKAIALVSSFVSLNFMSALMALSVVIAVFGLLVWYFERKGNEEEFGNGWKGLWNGFWWSAVTMTTVGYGDKSPKTTGGRLVALVWMFTAIIVISGFTASIASSLTVSQISSGVDNIEALNEKNCTTVKKSATDLWLADHYFLKRNARMELDSCLADLKSEKVDYVLYDQPILSFLNGQSDSKDFTLLDLQFNPQYYAFPVSKDVSKHLLDELNSSVLNITEGEEWKHQLRLVGL